MNDKHWMCRAAERSLRLEAEELRAALRKAASKLQGKTTNRDGRVRDALGIIRLALSKKRA